MCYSTCCFFVNCEIVRKKHPLITRISSLFVSISSLSLQIRLFTLCTLCVWVCLKHVTLAYPQQRYKSAKAQIPTDSLTTVTLHHQNTDPQWRPGSSCSCCCRCARVSHQITSDHSLLKVLYFVVELAENVSTASAGFSLALTLYYCVKFKNIAMKYCMLLQ